MAIRRLQNCFELFTHLGGGGGGGGRAKRRESLHTLIFSPFVCLFMTHFTVCMFHKKKETHFQWRFISHLKFYLKVEQLLSRRHDDRGRGFDCLLLEFYNVQTYVQNKRFYFKG